jgi:hypothetical protein
MPDLSSRLTAALADRYRIERELGAGGMATVYLAEDLKHQRQVAIKVLKPELAAVLGADRFIQEITTTAQLQHPHILPLFDSGTADGFLFYVMPYVEGETLRDKLNRETQLGVDEAVRITREVADALDYAHRHGVIHRDIKPENILLHDGRPMVADFGIALAVSAAAGGRMTETGMSLGTPHYMSPEQATADKEITGRSDVYSLASALYEMLTGDPPHTGSSAQQIIVKIIADEARPVGEVRKSVPPNVAAALAKALEKLPADRFESAKAFADALVDPGFRGRQETAVPGAGAPPRRQRVLVGGLAAVATVTTVVAVWALSRPVRPMSVVHYELPVTTTPFRFEGVPAEVTSDGSRIFYPGPAPAGGEVQLWVKRRERPSAEPLRGTEGLAMMAVSPDDQWIALVQDGALRKIPIDGGAPVPLGPRVVGDVASLTWLDDGTLLYGTNRDPSSGRFTVQQLSETGGTATQAWSSDLLFPRTLSPLPHGHALLTACRAPCNTSVAYVLDPASGGAREILSDVSAAEYADGVIVFSRQVGDVFAVGFDPDALDVRGEPVALPYQVRSFTALPSLAVSASGTMVFGGGDGPGQFDRFRLLWVDGSGRTTQVDTSWVFSVTQFAGDYGWALSPDGTRLAIGVNKAGEDDVWIKALPRGPASLLTHGPSPDRRPRWTADGGWVTFVTDTTVSMRRANGVGEDSVLWKGVADEGLLSPDGHWLLLRRGAVSSASGGRDIYAMRLGVDSVPRPLLANPYDEMAIALSPDGRWLAYQSNETGRIEVFVRPFPDVGSGKVQVSSAGGTAPLWARDGRTFYYLRGDDAVTAVPVAVDGTLGLGQTRALFTLPPGTARLGARYYTPWDIAPDGRFIMVESVDAAASRGNTLQVVENGLQEVKAMLEDGRH